MTEHQERLISHDELARVSFACARCGTSMTIDMNNEEQAKALARLGRPDTPRAAADALTCSICGQGFDRYLIESFYYLWRWRGLVKDSGKDLTFHLTVRGPAAGP